VPKLSATAAAAAFPGAPLLPPRAAVDGTHRRLLEVALRMFGDRGFHGASVRELAAAVGIHPSSIYAHLSSKQALLMELVLMGHEEHWERVSTAVAGAPDDVAERVRAWVTAHVGLHLDFPLLARVANKELHVLEPADAAKVMAVREQAADLLDALVAEGVAAGRFSASDPWLATVMIGSMGVRVSEWWDPDMGYEPAEVQAAFAEGALRIVGAR
jgi:AcrR family transcriptional regulator